METLLFILLIYGVSNIIIYNTIPFLEKLYGYIYSISPNYLGKLLSCMMCLSTWIGFMLSFMFIKLGYEQFSPFYSHGLDIQWLAIILDGFLASGCVWLIHTVQEKIEGGSE